MGRVKRIIFERKVKPFPNNVIFIEPEWISEEIELGRYRITALRWTGLYTRTGWSKDAEEIIEPDADYLCDTLQRLARSASPLMVVGHQLNSIVTLLGVSHWFRDHGWYATHVCRWDERFIATITDGESEILWRDLQNWLPGTLPDIAQWVGLESEDLQRFSPGRYSNPFHWAETCALVAAAYDRYREWVESHFDFGFHHTLSGLALALFSQTAECRHLVRAKEKSIIENERRGFYGGFCMAHKTGDLNTVPHHLLDANGLYAAVERDESFPHYYVSHKKNPLPRDLDRAENIGECLVHGVFSSPAGFLPVRRGKFLSWEQSQIECWLPYPEFQYITETGTVHKIKEIQLYKTMPLFRGLVSTWIENSERCKKSGDKYERKLWKNLSNSLFGKFAQRLGAVKRFPMEEGEEDGQEYYYDNSTCKSATVEKWCGSKLLTTDDDLSDSHFPSIAGWITSHARKRLFTWCSKAGWDTVCYNDTDSLIVTDPGFKRLQDEIDSYKTGRLKIESTADHCWIGGTKRYHIGAKHVDGGTPHCHYVSRTGGLYWTEREQLEGKSNEAYGALYSRVRFRKAMNDFDYEEWTNCLNGV